MTLTLETPSATAMSSQSTVDLGPFACPACGTVSFDPNDAVQGWCRMCKAATAFPFDGPGRKVLVLGDAHGDVWWLTHTVIPYAQATGCTTIMQLGDFGLVWSPELFDERLDRLSSALSDAGLTLVFLPGNHENHTLLRDLTRRCERNDDDHYVLRPNIFYTGRVAVWMWDGLRIAAVGGGVSIDRDARVEGVSWWPEETLQPVEVARACQLGPVDLLFTHDAPLGVPMHLVPDVASAAHRDHMTQIGRSLLPAYWFHGHYHASLFYRFHRAGGVTNVRGLHCNDASTHLDAMAPINLTSIRQGLSPKDAT